MIQANVAAAETLEEKKSPLVYRIHDTPSMAKLEALRDFLRSIDMTLPKGGNLRPSHFNRILERLNAAEAFETFLHTKFVGHKRFGLEGAESLIPMLDALLDRAGGAGVEEVVMGMAHRGRLNVLANVIGKSYSQIFREFEGELDPDAPQGSGDVKYHLGAEGTHRTPAGKSVDISLSPNPSHLEFVGPVVDGRARAKQTSRKGAVAQHDSTAAVPIVIHGDAAFAGQGVVAETLNLGALAGYETGGMSGEYASLVPVGFQLKTAPKVVTSDAAAFWKAP